MSDRHASRFEMFTASGYGRIARLTLGLVVIALGLFLVGGKVGWVLAALGLVPVAAGVFNFCPVAPVWGGHFLGSRYCGSGRNGR